MEEEIQNQNREESRRGGCVIQGSHGSDVNPVLGVESYDYLANNTEKPFSDDLQSQRFECSQKVTYNSQLSTTSLESWTQHYSHLAIGV